MSTLSGAIARREEGPAALIEQYRDDLALVAPSHVNPDKLYRTMIGLLRGNEYLARAAAGNPGSFIAAVFECAELGHRPGDTYHFVPFGNKITGIEDYKGEIERMYRAGAVISVKAEIVYANDEYDFDESSMQVPVHRRKRFAGKSERGKMIGAYAYAVMRGGALSRVIEMGEEEILEHKAASNGSGKADSPWNKWPRSMWLKTAVHELAKWVPTSNEYLTDQARAQGEMLRAASKPTSAPPAHGPAVPHPGGPVDGQADPIRVEVQRGTAVDGTVVDTPAGGRSLTDAQMRAIHASLRDLRIGDDEGKHAYASEVLGRPVASFNDLTTREASTLIDAIKRDAGKAQP